MRAREPDHEGVVERDGVRVGYDVYGAGEPTILVLTCWAITHAGQWKGRVPYLARRFRVITIEGRAGQALPGRPRQSRKVLSSTSTRSKPPTLPATKPMVYPPVVQAPP